MEIRCMDLRKHMMDTMKEWQLKIGYREGDMKLYYPGESLAELLHLPEESAEAELLRALDTFCDEVEQEFGRIQITGNYDRFCLDIPAKGCAYVAEKVPEPEFLKIFLQTITAPDSSMEAIRKCFASYGAEHGTGYRESMPEEKGAAAFYFEDSAVEEYVYWVEENEFGLTYHRFTRKDYERLL